MIYICPECGIKITSSKPQEICMGCFSPLGKAISEKELLSMPVQYIYCSVSFLNDYEYFGNSARTYFYQTENRFLRDGENIQVPVGGSSELKGAIVRGVYFIKPGKRPPYPPAQTKHLIETVSAPTPAGIRETPKPATTPNLLNRNRTEKEINDLKAEVLRRREERKKQL